jgi:SAM-dependent methyltransferase
MKASVTHSTSSSAGIGRPTAAETFDQYADAYDAALERGLSVTGEGADYYAGARVRFVADRLVRWVHRLRVEDALDFGCGTGGTAPLLRDAFEARRVIGVDVSSASIRRAQTDVEGLHYRFQTLDVPLPAGTIDLAYTNGVFHHIPPAEREAAFAYVFRALRGAGWFAFWENNPWNPGTRYIMSRIAFDSDAITLSPIEARRRLRAAGFRIIETRSLFYFPRVLRSLRSCERMLSRLPLGGQYLVLAQKPGNSR